jgi:hypothetical protein
MPKFQVFSGSVKLTILADDPQAAAVELLQTQRVNDCGIDGAASGQREIGEQIIVRERGERRAPERFITLHLLAHMNRQTPDAVWRQMLASFDPNNN